MKKYLLISIKLTATLLVMLCVFYFGIVYLIGKATPGAGDGETISANGKVVGYSLIGQKFTNDKYFWTRPSAVDYNAAGSAGSNKGPSNTDYLKIVQQRIDTFLAHNPGVRKDQIPAEMVTASGSGLDPHISPTAAYLQIARIAQARNIDQQKLKSLVDEHIEKNAVGPKVINVLKLNIALDDLNSERK